jgi:uncharacterized protein YecA (UPF0149 family)
VAPENQNSLQRLGAVDGQSRGWHARRRAERKRLGWVQRQNAVALGRMDPIVSGSAVSVGRNDPCTCGSGKKLKKCCGGTR